MEDAWLAADGPGTGGTVADGVVAACGAAAARSTTRREEPSGRQVEKAQIVISSSCEPKTNDT